MKKQYNMCYGQRKWKGFILKRGDTEKTKTLSSITLGDRHGREIRCIQWVNRKLTSAGRMNEKWGRTFFIDIYITIIIKIFKKYCWFFEFHLNTSWILGTCRRNICPGFIHLFNTVKLSTYYDEGTILKAEDTILNKRQGKQFKN